MMKSINNSILLVTVFAFNFFSYSQDVNNDEAKTTSSNRCPLQGPCFKNNIKLQDGKYTGSYIIGDDGRYQSIYSSQNYGSFYELYVKANFFANSDRVKSLDFRIINYDGPLNLGFANLKDSKNGKNELYFNEKDGVLGLRIIVKGKDSYKSMSYTLPSDTKITKDNLKQINIFRMLVPMNGLKLNATVSNQIFDTEFYERSGLEINRKKIVPNGHFDFDKPDYFGPLIEQISKPDYFKDLLKINKNGGTITILSKDSNCYTSTMYVKN